MQLLKLKLVEMAKDGSARWRASDDAVLVILANVAYFKPVRYPQPIPEDAPENAKPETLDGVRAVFCASIDSVNGPLSDDFAVTMAELEASLKFQIGAYVAVAPPR